MRDSAKSVPRSQCCLTLANTHAFQRSLFFKRLPHASSRAVLNMPAHASNTADPPKAATLLQSGRSQAHRSAGLSGDPATE